MRLNSSFRDHLCRFYGRHEPQRSHGILAVLRAILFIAFLFPFFLQAEVAFGAAARENSIQAQIRQEQAKAKARRDGLSRLTAEERNVDKELAAAESRIVALEASLEKETKRLESLAASDSELLAKGEAVREERRKTESAMSEVLRVLWELHARRVGVKGRDLPDWPVTDREHAWSVELFASLDAYRQTLASQQKELDAVAAKREALSHEVAARIAARNTEKERLLQNRVQYEQRLASLRREKRETEEELTAILALVQNLNLQQQSMDEQTDIAKAKGKLPWPVMGTVRGRYNPAAKPPVRGLTVALDGESPVRAVHRGKVVHNDVLRGIGRVVILMHGEEYYSLYAFLSESPLSLGQDVKRGDIVGTSGFVTSINGPGVYFELRHHQKTVNPEQWLRKM